MSIKDGWHTIAGYDVYIEDGKVIRGTLGYGSFYRSAWIYKHYAGGWYNISGELSVSSFRRHVKKGDVILA